MTRLNQECSSGCLDRALSGRCRANMAHTRQSRPDAGLGFQVNLLSFPLFFPSGWLNRVQIGLKLVNSRGSRSPGRKKHNNDADSPELAHPRHTLLRVVPFGAFHGKKPPTPLSRGPRAHPPGGGKGGIWEATPPAHRPAVGRIAAWTRRRLYQDGSYLGMNSTTEARNESRVARGRGAACQSESGSPSLVNPGSVPLSSLRI